MFDQQEKRRPKKTLKDSDTFTVDLDQFRVHHANFELKLFGSFGVIDVTDRQTDRQMLQTGRQTDRCYRQETDPG